VFFVGTVLQAPLLVVTGFLAGPVLMPLFMGVAFFHFFTQPPGNHMVADFTPPRLRGLGYGVYFFAVFGAGALGATFGGWVSERVGLAWTFPALTILLVPAVAAVILLILRERRSSGPQPGAVA
jgi:predicted MFS family arabinose efflux permease